MAWGKFNRIARANGTRYPATAKQTAVLNVVGIIMNHEVNRPTEVN